MKKILSVILTLTMLLSFVCFPVSAESKYNSIERARLGSLLDGFGQLFGVTYAYSMDYPIGDAWAIYESEDSTIEDYVQAADDLEEALLNVYIYPIDLAIVTYENALKEQNYNNWYSEEEWSDFQEALEAMGEVIENLDNLDINNGRSREVSDAFFALMKAYNKMTDSYTVKGDLNKDGAVNVADVTLLQKYLAGTENLTGAQKMLTGAYKYENLSIANATTIQKYTVGIIDEFPDYNIFISDYIEDLPVDCMDHDLFMEKIFNYNICPRKYQSYYDFDANSTGVYILYNYYYWCYQNNYYQ